MKGKQGTKEQKTERKKERCFFSRAKNKRMKAKNRMKERNKGLWKERKERQRQEHNNEEQRTKEKKEERKEEERRESRGRESSVAERYDC